uniref:Uncharacterized protein n=1 Tax=Lotharella oceanica TaxID=641309 RepID=A0A7S2TPP6_9EUKA|mmetsp:Transcript_22165/g.41532  ORF Transcript_22165/g.41532 Transcript_22165/m.41532 type:complete len:421 (+) Transcript_22165:105-1367(+)|eukprot:CAMPEP_0170168922 /NCGR_PEP_ID=MMETSP0040_2-20121228/1884_1 /TAXON_ID=641309 /ORGANISM="Lotharella oceanica, Strain CCMP622" /LENGTH=420 /DNA_ID=CAMNT_0010407377 /DNA_START=58 /DNA_END=1320 /DNA_ORIENTATION=+
MQNRMRKSSSETRFGIDELVDLGEPIDKLNCTQNLRSIFHRVPSLGTIGLHRLESINKLTKDKNKYFFYLFLAILLIVIGALMARVAYKRNRESMHTNLAREVASMGDPFVATPEHYQGKISFVQALQAKDLSAFDVQLLSLKKNFKLSDLAMFLIIASPEDIKEVRRHIQEINSKFSNIFPFHVVEATTIVPELYFLTKHSEAEVAPYYKEHKFGYITRMIVKLAAAESVPTEFYLALDADVVCVRPTSFNSLVQKGRAAVNKGKMSFDTHYQWKGAKHVLDAPPSLLADETAYGGVPSLYHRIAVHKLKTYLEIVYQQPWRYSLLRYLFGWSDYSLYYTFLRMANAFEKYHSASADGVFRAKGISEGMIGTKGWEKWDYTSALSPSGLGSFVHLNGLLDLSEDEINAKFRPFFVGSES